MSLKFNGNGKELFEDLFRNEQLKFPVNFHLKVILDATIPDHVNRKEVEKVLDDLQIRHNSWKDKLSQQGRYISFTVNVDIVSSEQLHEMYDRLKDIPGVKFAL